MNDLIQKTLNKINKEHIAPEPRWKFLVRKSFYWSLVGVFVFLGALAFSVSYYLISQLDWDLHQTMQRNFFFYSVSILPYFWLIFLLSFLVVAFFSLRNTERGYRFHWSGVLSVIILSLLLVAVFFYKFNLGGKMNNWIVGHVPYATEHTVTKEVQWMQPEDGLLAGTILNIEKSQFQLEDLRGKLWVIDFGKETKIRPAVDFSVGQMVKIIGNKKDDKTFEAVELRPWVGRGEMGPNSGHRMMRNNLNK